MKSSKGFTLIELLVVIAILGVLTATAFPTYRTFRRRAVGVEATTIMKQLINAELMYYLEHNAYFLGTNNSIQVYHDGRDPSLSDIQEVWNALHVRLPTGHFLDTIVNGDPNSQIFLSVGTPSENPFPIFKNGDTKIQASLDTNGKVVYY